MAEDLPEGFAGQQETFLNIKGEASASTCSTSFVLRWPTRRWRDVNQAGEISRHGGCARPSWVFSAVAERSFSV